MSFKIPRCYQEGWGYGGNGRHPHPPNMSSPKASLWIAGSHLACNHLRKPDISGGGGNSGMFPEGRGRSPSF